MRKISKAAVGVFAGVLLLGLIVWLTSRPKILQSGPPPMVRVECQPEQVEVMILGTFHFTQQEEVDLLHPDRQEELAQMVSQLAMFAPDKVTVEYPYARNDELKASYQRYLGISADSVRSRNEITQIGFRLGRQLGHDRVFGVDVLMNLWHDSIRVFDEQYPGARGRLRRRWNVRYPPSPEPESGASLEEMLRPWNTDAPPGNAEYGLFMPLVEGDIYAGALKLRPWYDRNLRIVQNFFRVLEDGDQRLFLVIGGSHVRVLRQILELTPQFCAVDPLGFMTDAQTP